jgi:hypothetical protein
MKYKIGDKIVFKDTNQEGCVLVGGYDTLLPVQSRDKYLIVRKAQRCYNDHCKPQCEVCSGNCYQIYDDGVSIDMAENFGWCNIEENTKLYKWRPTYPKQFKLR